MKKLYWFFVLTIFLCGALFSENVLAAPTVTNFSANPSIITEGDRATINFSVTNPTPGIRCVFTTVGGLSSTFATVLTSLDRSVSVNPTSTTTYTLDCRDNANNSAPQRTVELKVEGRVEIELFCNDNVITLPSSNDCTWDVLGNIWSTKRISNCVFVSYTPLSGQYCTPSAPPYPNIARFWPSPPNSALINLYGYYGVPTVSTTITCDGLYRKVTVSASVSRCVPPPPPPPAPTLNFTVKEVGNLGNSASNGGSINISNGNSATLSWSSSNATSCTAVINSPNESWDSGGLTSNPGVLTGNLSHGFYQYTLRCVNGSGGSSSRTVFVVVNPDLTIDASDGPVSVSAGDNMDIGWKAVHCLGTCSCLPTSGASWAVSPKNLAGGSETITATTTSLYTLRCSGPGGTIGSDSVQVNVSAIPNFTLTVGKSGSGTGTITSAPAGINYPGDTVESYAPGTSVVMTATATLGSTFVGWSGDCSGPSCTVVMNSAKNVTATFDPPVTCTCNNPNVCIGDSYTGAGSGCTPNGCPGTKNCKQYWKEVAP